MLMYRDRSMSIRDYLMLDHLDSAHAILCVLTRIIPGTLCLTLHHWLPFNPRIAFDPRANVFEIKHDAHCPTLPNSDYPISIALKAHLVNTYLPSHVT